MLFILRLSKLLSILVLTPDSSALMPIRINVLLEFVFSLKCTFTILSLASHSALTYHVIHYRTVRPT